MPNLSGFMDVGFRSWITGMAMVLASWILPFLREFPMEKEVFWAGIGIAIGVKGIEKALKKKNGP